MQALMLGSSWSGWMNKADVFQAVLPTGGMGAQITVQTNYIARPLLDLIASSLAGKSGPTSMALATYAANAVPQNQYKIAAAQIQEVDLPAANAGGHDTLLIGVKFAQAPFESGVPTTHPPGNPLGQVLRSNYFHLQFDGLDATSAISIGSMAIVVPYALKGSLPQLVLTYSNAASGQAFSTGLQSWFRAQTTRNGTLTLLAADFKTALMVVQYRGLRVISVNSPSSGPSTATFTMTGISLQPGLLP